MATLTPIAPSSSGVVITPAAASGGGDKYANPNGTSVLNVINGSGSSINVTLTARMTTRPADGPFDAQTVADKVIAVAAGAQKQIRVGTAFNDSNGDVSVAYSSPTSVTVYVTKP